MGGVATGEVRVGLAGLGRFGKLHAAVLAEMPGARLVSVCDPDPAQVADVAGRYGVAGRFATLEEMLAAGGLDAVWLVTPEHLHAEQAMAVVRAGLPLFLEKPLATTHAEGQAILAAADGANVPVQVGFLLRFETRHAMLRADVLSGAYGDLVSIRVKRNVSRAWFPTYGDRAHPVYETSIHDLDLLLWLAGSRCTAVYAVERNHSGMTYPDACWALLQFASGTVGIVETSWFVPDGAPATVLTPDWKGTIDADLEVIGTERTGRVTALAGGVAAWTPEVTFLPDAGLWPEVAGSIGGAIREEDRHFLARVRTRAASRVASAAAALEGLRVAEAIVRSAAEGREVRLD